MTYNSRGQTELVSQYDDDAVGSGSKTDEVKYTYEDWGNISQIEQDRDGAVGGGGNQYTVSWPYAKNTSGMNPIRRATITYPGSGTAVTWHYNYGSGIDTNASRVSQIGNQPTLSFVPYVTYKYNGAANVIRTYLEEPDAFYDLDGTSARTYTDLDRFNRVLGSTWTKDLGTDRDFYSVSISYDRDSNITDITDNVLKAGVAGNRNFDVKYGIDNLNRVTRADEGTFSSGSISNRSRDEQWTLTQVGNWDREKLDLDGNGTFTGSGELDDTRTHNDANELLTRDTDSNASVNYTQAHDAVGNMTDDGQSYKFIYDVFGRLRKITDRAGSPNLIEEYRYNG
ncbi:MAG: hypothetical protein IAG10_22520, partial [Planctomycetaceae bacterium]|nr:hypothetical protein [Planctomycetaceae bacterium]